MEPMQVRCDFNHGGSPPLILKRLCSYVHTLGPYKPDKPGYRTPTVRGVIIFVLVSYRPDSSIMEQSTE